ncbi:MAG: hypothetical protein FWC26_06935 [Fibromonadales bacterium]|nr:hypothetical protein [Fibromonadales bacterium]
MVSISKLASAEEAAKLIETGNAYLISGDERVLAKLPKGNWIGGTTCYFSIGGKAVEDRDNVFITGFPEFVKMKCIKTYSENFIPSVAKDACENGFSILLMPAGSEPSLQYAQFSPMYSDLFFRPIIGWITGMYLPDWNPASPHKEKRPKVFNGQTGECEINVAEAMHFSLPANKVAVVKTISPFKVKENSPVITFEGNNSLIVKEAYLNGKQVNLPKYIIENNIDYRTPMQANYSGIPINVSFPSEIQGDEMLLRQAVFSDVEYRFTEMAEQPDTYSINNLIDKEKYICGCTCIFNHLTFNKNGYIPCGVDGPLTFGEIAYQIMGNASTYLELEEA